MPNRSDEGMVALDYYTFEPVTGETRTYYVVIATMAGRSAASGQPWEEIRRLGNSYATEEKGRAALERKRREVAQLRDKVERGEAIPYGKKHLLSIARLELKRIDDFVRRDVNDVEVEIFGEITEGPRHFQLPAGQVIATPPPRA